MDEEVKHNLVLVTYTAVEPFLKMLEKNSWSVNLNHLESNQPHAAGFRITPYVIIQLRLGDELHLLKLIGKVYDYWGDQFEDHRISRQKAIDWSKDLAADCLQTLLQKGLTVVANSHYCHPALIEAAGVYVGMEIPPEFNRLQGEHND